MTSPSEGGQPKPSDAADAFDLGGYFRERVRRIDAALGTILPSPRSASNADLSRLFEAMRYSVFAGGKRLRPILAIAACEAVKGKAEKALPVACAIELIHTYSLIHDDLPSMDNADLRRGKTTCHKVFGEPQAILAGDALLTLGFEILARNPSKLPAAAVVRIIQAIARASGPDGMVAGQAIDIGQVPATPTPARIEDLERRKTGALIQAALTAGALVKGASAATLGALQRYGLKIGVAFQIADDLLDATSTSSQLGKEAGQDEKLRKTTFVTLYGIEGARNKANYLAESAQRSLRPFGPGADPLRAIARWVVSRSR
ncbi:MAG: polyprenyl synthetase family protein [Nitrospirae bacterium]|nr:polyprenyl synthetase family protein [Nitrospirota bacterium]